MKRRTKTEPASDEPLVIPDGYDLIEQGKSLVCVRYVDATRTAYRPLADEQGRYIKSVSPERRDDGIRYLQEAARRAEREAAAIARAEAGEVGDASQPVSPARQDHAPRRTVRREKADTPVVAPAIPVVPEPVPVPVPLVTLAQASLFGDPVAPVAPVALSFACARSSRSVRRRSA